MEIEARTEVKNLDEIRQELIALGVVFKSTQRQVDSYYKEEGKEKEAQEPGSSVLRIRTQNEKNFLTFKALTEQRGAWIEHEVEIDDPEEMDSILSEIGYVKVLTMAKERTSGTFEDLEVCLDNIGELGYFIEIAVDSEDKEGGKEKIVRFLNKLGFKEEEIEHRGYARILFENQGVMYEGVD
jgi:adenylate cyclase class 2